MNWKNPLNVCESGIIYLTHILLDSSTIRHKMLSAKEESSLLDKSNFSNGSLRRTIWDITIMVAAISVCSKKQVSFY